MANYTSPLAQRIFVQAASSLGVVNNTGGTWNSAGAQYQRVEDNALTLNPNEPKQPVNIKHGTPSNLASIFQRKSGTWAFSIPIIPNGTQAVAPDCDLLMQGVFGGTGSLVTGTGLGNAWQYGFHDFQTTLLTILSFIHGQSATASRFGVGCIVTRATITFNGNILTCALTGVCVGVATVETFSVMDPAAKGGLTSFPVEPSSISANGNVINGFGGNLYWGLTQLIGQCNNLQIDIETGISLNDSFVDSSYPLAINYGPRKVTFTVGFVNNDSSILSTMKQNARTNTPQSLSFYLGTQPGARVYFIAQGIQLVPETLQDQTSYVEASFGQSMTSVAPGASNDLVFGFA